MLRKLKREKPAERERQMNRTTTKYAANDLGDDLLNGLAEIEADTRDTLDAVPAAEYDGGEWEALRNALKEARESLDAIEAMLDAKQTEADEAEGENAPEEYESIWE